MIFKPTLKSVVNKSIVGKTEKSKAVFTYMDIMSIKNESDMFIPISVSTRGVGKGTIIRAITTTIKNTILISLCFAIKETILTALSYPRINHFPSNKNNNQACFLLRCLFVQAITLGLL